jgi:hypothetical protein
MKKFRTWYDTRIEEVEVIRETAKFVIIKEKNMYNEDTFERRDTKRTDIGYNYFDAWQEARQFLIDREEIAIIKLLNEVKQHAALKKLGEAKRKRGKALVEERIAGEFSDWIENQCPHWDIDVEPFCVELDGPCEYREGGCPIRIELHEIAREQLHQEGKL